MPILLWNGSFWANYGSPTEQDLLDVWGANVDDVWAVGLSGTLLHWNGLLWKQEEKTSAYDLSGVHGTGPNRVVVVGAGGLYMEWDGNHWTRRDVGTILPLRRVWVGEHETWSLPSWGNDPQSKGFNFLHVTDSGVERVVGVTPYLLRRIFGTAADRLWAVGDFNTVLEYDGTAWRPLPSPQSPQRPPPVFETVLAVWGTSAEDLWVAGNGLAFYRRTPTGFRSADTAPGFVNGMFGFSENEIFAVGNGGLLMRWNGAQWSSLSDNNYLSYNGLFSLGNNQALATSLEGVISYFDGSSWYPTYYFGRQIFSMWGTGADNLWVVGDLGGIYKYTGSSWQKQASKTLAALLSISGRSPTDIWAVGLDESGGKYLHFDGSAWATVPIPASFVPIHVWDSGADDVWFVGLDAAILKYSRSTNSLVSFSMANNIDMNTVWGSSASDVWMAGFRADTAQGNAAVLLHWDGKILTALAPEGFSQNDSIDTIWGLGPNDVWASGPAILAHYDGVKWTRNYGLGSTLRAFVNTAPPGSPPELLAAGLDGAILRRRAR